MTPFVTSHTTSPSKSVFYFSTSYLYTLMKLISFVNLSFFGLLNYTQSMTLSLAICIGMRFVPVLCTFFVGYKLAFNYLKAKRFVDAIDTCHHVSRIISHPISLSF